MRPGADGLQGNAWPAPFRPGRSAAHSHRPAAAGPARPRPAPPARGRGGGWGLHVDASPASPVRAEVRAGCAALRRAASAEGRGLRSREPRSLRGRSAWLGPGTVPSRREVGGLSRALPVVGRGRVACARRGGVWPALPPCFSMRAAAVSWAGARGAGGSARC